MAVERLSKDGELMQVVQANQSMKKTLWKYESGLRYWEKKVYTYPKRKEKVITLEGRKKV